MRRSTCCTPFFNVLSILVFIPTLGILFGTQEPVYTAPTYSGIGSLKSYLEQQLNYFITTQSEQSDEVQALVAIVLLSALIFLLKNVFRYLAAYVLSFFAHWYRQRPSRSTVQ
jgi:hypothetical protein